MFGLIAWRATNQGIPLIAQEQGIRPVRFIESAAQRYGLQHTQAILALSTERANYLRNCGGNPKNIFVIPNGFDSDVFGPKELNRDDNNNEFRILIVARLSEEKDPLTMADGISIFKKRGLNFKVTIIGRGPMKDVVEERFARESIKPEFIDFVSQKELSNYYSSADVLVLTSLFEGMPQVVLEAMATGLPVIGTNIPGTKDALGDDGILIPIKDPVTLADVLLFLVENPKERLRYREKSLKRASIFTWDAVANRIRELYCNFL